MNRDNIKLSQLRSLAAVAECGNFSEAGLQLGVSQSAISHAIATLEDELGVILFSRGRHGAQLTPVGDRMVQYARQMLDLLDAMDKEANLARGLKSGEVRVGSFRSVATHVLPDIIAQFRQCFPQIAVSISEFRGDDGIEQALRKGTIDIAFTCLPTPDDFDSWELFRDEYLVFFPPGIDIPTKLTWDYLNTYPMILPPDTDYCSILIRNHFATLKQTIQPVFTINEDSTILGMVQRGLGATVMARLAAEPLSPDIQIRRLPIPLERIIRVSVLHEALLPPSVYAFLDTLKSTHHWGRFPFLRHVQTV